MKYKNRVRSRISNLKDMKNPNLRRTVLCGSVTPERMAKMTAEVWCLLIVLAMLLIFQRIEWPEITTYIWKFFLCCHCLGNGQWRAEGNEEEFDQRSCQGPPDGHHRRHSDWFIHLWQMQGEELHLHTGRDELWKGLYLCCDEIADKFNFKFPVTMHPFAVL